MASSEKKAQHLQKLLRAAYVSKEQIEIEPGTRWRMDVMRDIRRLGPLNVQFNPFMMFNRVVWRFAEAACVVALVMTVYVGFTGWNPIEEVTSLYLANPVEFTVSQVLGEYESYE
ncbi:hypothetical protein U27_03409 [Candidatus Vecturithrix granuli]|uniref:Uncharacterized protein n=1 Tax=Vecturithrix granuli TaxID=1499967 RepID=A0A081BVU2_VECG1|nr:hypothetical protein U27_03409 [Candidatus Vecturithrix granuli]